MRPIFLNRQNPSHIGQSHIFLVFQQVSQKIEIQPLGLFIMGILPENAVPFVQDNDKLPPRTGKDIA